MKGKSNKYLIFGVCICLVLYLAILMLTPAQVNWELSFSKEDDIPFGNKILFDELSTLFPDGEIETSYLPVYNYFQDIPDKPCNLIIINNEFAPDTFDREKLMLLAFEGSNIFISSGEFSNEIKDELGFEVDEEFDLHPEVNDSIILKLVNPNLTNHFGYCYKKAFSRISFVDYDTLNTTVLGINAQAKTNFIKMKFGEGNFFIHTNPLVFTNYNLLQGNNYEYAFKSLSYLPKSSVVWDEFYKQKPRPSGSELRYILSQKGLRNAWYITLFGVLAFLIFGAKRKQRVIPVFEDPKNTTLTFIETIGRLYFKRKNHQDIAQKKFRYFLEFLRTRYYINTDELTEEMMEEISEKCHVPLKSIRKIFSQVSRLNSDLSFTEEDLEQFSKNIEFVYQRCKTNK